MERGRHVWRAELLVAVLRLHIARDGDGAVGAHALAVGERGRRAAHDLGVAEVNAVLIAPGEGVAHARTCPDVQPLGAAVWPQLHEVEANTELGIVEVHQVVAVGLDGHRSGV